MLDRPEYVYNVNYSKRKNKTLNLFWIGFVIYTFGLVLISPRTVNITLCRGLQVVGMVLLVPTSLILARMRFGVRSIYFKMFFIFYVLWLAGIVSRGFMFNYEFISFMLFFPFGLLGYMVPLIILFPLDLVYYKKIFQVIVALAIIYLLLDAAFFRTLLTMTTESDTSQDTTESFSKMLALPSAFILLTYKYHKKWIKLLAGGVIAITLLVAIYQARRGLVFMCGMTVLCSYTLFLFTAKKKVLFLVFSIILLLVLAASASTIVSKKSNLFGHLLERKNEDTRTKPVECFYDDMKRKDWIIGKGIVGEYWCPMIDENDVTGYRSTIETGYLQTILNGGIISIALLMLIAVPAMINCLFFSKNVLGRASGLWILMVTLNMYPTIMTGFTFTYLLYWICIWIGYSKDIRKMPDEYIKELLTFKPQFSS